MSKNVIVVGGGLAGLAAALFLARGGCRVTIFEKRRNLGGRAVTHLRHGYRFNIGAHAVYRTGPAASVYRELGIPLRGRRAKAGGYALQNGELHTFPFAFPGWLSSSVLSLGAKAEALALFFRIWRVDPKTCANLTAREWLEANVKHADLRAAAAALMRLATYADHLDTMSAATALAQLKLVMRGAVYIDEGWQKLVDSLHSAAVAAGVNFVTSSRIVAVHHQDGRVQSIELGGLEMDVDRMDTQSIALPELTPDAVQGPRIPADNVVLAVDPASAAELVGDPKLTAPWTSSRAVTAACLDVALSKLPNPKKTFALGIDQPLYFSVHSQWAQLTPKGGALVHLVKYRKSAAARSDEIEESRVRRSAESAQDESELEALLDKMQPGWRDLVVHRRFLPSMTVSNALVTPNMQRPSSATPVRGLYIAGDWVGSEGFLSDAALASARAASKAILAPVSSAVSSRA